LRTARYRTDRISSIMHAAAVPTAACRARRSAGWGHAQPV